MNFIAAYWTAAQVKSLCTLALPRVYLTELQQEGDEKGITQGHSQISRLPEWKQNKKKGKQQGYLQ